VAERSRTTAKQRSAARAEPILSIGLMSGTSADGIDAVLIDRSGNGPPGSIAALTELDSLVA